MGLDVWFREDMTRILLALGSAGAHHGPKYLKALHDVALAFGLEAPTLARFGPPIPHVLNDPAQGMLGTAQDDHNWPE
jgi:hypothetical protein